jgi:DNA polymerase-3 subunit epsilon
VREFIDKLKFDHKNLILIDRGRTVNERSAVLIESGQYKGYAFFDLNYQINKPEILHNILIPMPDNRDTRNIIRGAIQKNKRLKIVSF